MELVIFVSESCPRTRVGLMNCFKSVPEQVQTKVHKKESKCTKEEDRNRGKSACFSATLVDCHIYSHFYMLNT